MTEWFNASDSPNVQGRFVTETFIDAATSRAAGKQVDAERTLCLIRVVGSNDIVPAKVRGADGEALIKRFPDAWAAFQGNDVDVEDGFPIEELPTVSQERGLMLRNSGVRTIEQMAEVDESVVNRLGFGARDLQRAANDFLLARQVEADPPKPKRRGRPPKIKQEAAE